jgi:GH18 family chitinase
LESVLTAISVGGWSSSTQAEIHPLAKTDWRLKQHNTIALSAIVLATHVFHFGIVK